MESGLQHGSSKRTANLHQVPQSELKSILKLHWRLGPLIINFTMPKFKNIQEKIELAKWPTAWIAIGFVTGCLAFPIGSSMVARGNTVVAGGLSFTLTHGGNLLEVSVDDHRDSDTSDDPNALTTIIFPKPDKYWTVRHNDGSEWTLDGRDITGLPKDKQTNFTSADLIYIDPGMVVSFPLGTHPHIGILHLDATRVAVSSALQRDLTLSSHGLQVWKGKVDLTIR